MGSNLWELGQIFVCNLHASATYMRRHTVDIRFFTINICPVYVCSCPGGYYLNEYSVWYICSAADNMGMQCASRACARTILNMVEFR